MAQKFGVHVRQLAYRFINNGEKVESREILAISPFQVWFRCLLTERTDIELEADYSMPSTTLGPQWRAAMRVENSTFAWAGL